MTPKQGYVEVRVDSVRLVLWWEACGFAKRLPSDGHRGTGYTAHVPDMVLHSNDRRVYATFLRGLYEADGDTSAGYPTLKNTSLGLVRDAYRPMPLAMAFDHPLGQAPFAAARAGGPPRWPRCGR